MMTIQKFTPPFLYSYQCGSTLLTSYIPVYMYATSFQLVAGVLRLVVVLNSNIQKHPWLINLTAGICWPDFWPKNISDDNVEPPTAQLIQPSQIISNFMNHIVLLLTFGLCSPLLAVYLTCSVCVNLSSWLMLIGRFIVQRNFMFCPLLASSQPNPLIRTLENDSSGEGISDPYLILLNHQLQGVHSYLPVCLGPIILISCVFSTLISWDIAGDEVGWFHSIWVPTVGLIILFLLHIWNKILSNFIKIENFLPSFLLPPSLPHPVIDPSDHPTVELTSQSSPSNDNIFE